ncbi:MAG: DNA modification methylase [Bryobacteraceae bacterium]
MEIHVLSVNKFVPYSRNLRKNDHAVDQMVASIQQFGFKIPILARSNGAVVDGHLRLKAARRLGMTEVPVILCDEWSDVQVKAFRLMVNRSASWAEWDFELVALELQDLKAIDFDLVFTGFDAVEIDEMLFGDQEKREDDIAPELPAEAVTRTGDLWLCGSHRVLCGDATSPDAIAALFGSVKPALMITDPPYGVEYDPQWRERAGLGHTRQSGTVANDDQVDWTAAYRLFPGDVAYVWHAGLHAGEVARGLEAAGFQIRSQIIWAKQHFALSRGDYHWKHEPCWYAVREGKPSNWNGDRTQSTLWQVANLNPVGGSSDEAATGHGTQKPVELMRRPILNHTERGGVIYDPFLGSGTTLIAAELTDRVCCGLDIDQRYVDVIVKRWQQLTGKSAVLEGDHRSFDQVAAERIPERVVA